MANFTQDAILKTFGDLLEALPFEKITVSGDMTSRPPRADEDRWIVTAVRPKER